VQYTIDGEHEAPSLMLERSHRMVSVYIFWKWRPRKYSSVNRVQSYLFRNREYSS